MRCSFNGEMGIIRDCIVIDICEIWEERQRVGEIRERSDDGYRYWKGMGTGAEAGGLGLGVF
jgi:hypothetical protein